MNALIVGLNTKYWSNHYLSTAKQDMPEPKIELMEAAQHTLTDILGNPW